MSIQMPGYHQQVLYQADPNVVHNLRLMRDRVHHICRQHMNQIVRIETMDGQVLVGRIMNCDKGIMYLAVSKQGGYRAFFGSPFSSPSDELILTLVLYELLVITLLYT
ncbi:hypothetical protein [Paenibacillus tuaregi]|uniref:hypothetical protein n=1 Tax=Paenibacillus tuaregi TaxID=1816681 RepID=UPI000837CD37|nr:hypothetical protein [Paenibacillus tuaregi]